MAYRYRLEPTPEQLGKLRRFAGSCRYVYNRAVAAFRLDEVPERVSYAALCKWLTELKRDTPWLAEPPSQSLQQALKDLTQACRRVSDERRKGRSAHVRPRRLADGLGSIRFPQNVRLAEAWGTSGLHTYVVLPKLGAVKYRRSRTLPEGAEIVQATVVEECGKWYVSIVFRSMQDVPDVGRDASMVGVDLGIRHFAAVYDGTESVFHDIPASVRSA